MPPCFPNSAMLFCDMSTSSLKQNCDRIVVVTPRANHNAFRFLFEDLPQTCNVDIVFVVDSSSSITSHAFAAAKQMVVDMVQVSPKVAYLNHC